MKVTYLNLTHFRSIRSAEFRFQPGFNLIVGVNGVGKSSVLNALTVCLSAYVKRANDLPGRVENFALSDIHVGASALNVECGVQIGTMEYRYLIHRPRELSVPQQGKEGSPREQTIDTPTQESLLPVPPPLKDSVGWEPDGRPLAVLFSTRRAVPSIRTPRRRAAAGGTAAAFGDAFASRELRLSEIAAWMNVQGSMGAESPSAASMLSALQDTVRLFLGGYKGLRVDDTGRELLIDREDGTVAVRHMSDGERGTLALVLDLTRRIVQANPEMANPVVEAEAVVLIDELDLHLHPAWQRQIIHNLTSTFPRCQFIATTHSPQIIGEVERDRICIMTDGEVYSPTHSFGVDSSRVLEEIMDADPRTERAQALLSRLSERIGERRHEEARWLLTKLVDLLGEDDPEVTRIQTLLEFLEDPE